MRILVTGTTGYIAKRLVLNLLEKDHRIICCVRDLNRIPDEIESKKGIEFIKVDFLDTQDVVFPEDIDVAYYLIHSMAATGDEGGRDGVSKMRMQLWTELPLVPQPG